MERYIKKKKEVLERHIIYIYIYKNKDKINKKKKGTFVPGSAWPAHGRNTWKYNERKKEKKTEKEKKSMRNTGTRIHTHDIHTPAARLKKEIRLKMETLLHTRCLRERVDRD